VATAVKIHAEGGYNPDAMLVVEADQLGRESALRKTAEKENGAVGIVCYEDETGDVARMTREALAVDKVGLTADALDRFVGRLPRERGLMRQEIERLALFIGPGSGRTIDVDELEQHPLLKANPRSWPCDPPPCTWEGCAGSISCKPMARGPRRRPRRPGSSGNRRRKCCVRPAPGG
jgi:hypothetical protein